MDKRVWLLSGSATAALLLGAGTAEAQATAPATDGKAVSEVVVTAQRLDAARETIQPQTGASTYTMPREAIEQLPGGENVQLNTAVLQMPGVAQDSYGQLHVRGDHANIQYRFNGVILPEGLSFFGQVLSPRIANSIELITGALPAEYGLRTAGILDIRTKTGLQNGGQIGVYGGSHGDYEPSVEYGGSSGSNSYFGSLSYQQNQLGIESVDGSSTPLHDRTTQTQGFAYFDHIIDDTSRISVFAGGSNQDFQIPDPTGGQPGAGFQYAGQTLFPSERLNQNQHEGNAFVAGSYLKTTDQFTGQVSAYARYSQLQYSPDVLGELLYNGSTQFATKQDIAVGVQAEGAYKLNAQHTVRAGLVFEDDHGTSATKALAFQTDDMGNLLTDVAGNNLAQTIVDNANVTAKTYSVYVQDEYKPLDQLTLNYGLRFDQLNSFRSENQVSPRVNFVWTPLAGTTVHGGYARYFTPPPFELVANETIQKFNNTVAYPAVPVDTTPFSDRENYFDLGVQQKLPAGFTVGVDGYYRTDYHLIDEGQFGAPIILTPFNYNHGIIQGAELTTDYVRGPFTAYANLAWSQAKGKDIVSSQFNFGPDEQGYISTHYIYLDHNETWSGSFGVAYRIGDTRLAVDGNYGTGLRQTPDGGVPNGAAVQTYTTVNLSMQQRLDLPAAGPITLRFDVVNLLDDTYEIRTGTGVGVGAPQWGARRGFFGGFTKAF